VTPAAADALSGAPLRASPGPDLPPASVDRELR